MTATAIDHATCGHVQHITLDGSRHLEIHTAIWNLIVKWSHEANAEDAGTGGTVRAEVKRACIKELVDAVHPFEVEQ